MRRPKPPLFLARAVYRRRRLRDAARLVPLVGAFLLLLPMLWRQEGGLGAGWDWLSLFAVWALLIGLAAALAPGLAAADSDAEPAADRDGAP